MVDHPNDELLASYVLQTITDEEREHIDHHLLRCAACRAHLSKHEVAVRRIRYELTADLRHLAPSNRSAFARVAPDVNRSRRWRWLRTITARGLALGPQLALWTVIVTILVLIVQGPFLSDPRPTAADLATDAAFENRNLHLYSEQAVLNSGPSGTWDDWWVNPGYVMFHDGQFHMFYNGKSVSRSTVSIGYATSTDGLNWSRAATEPVLTAEAVAWANNLKHVSANTVLVEDGRWIMYFTDGLALLYTGQVGRATASSPLGPWTVDVQPVLLPGARGEWDEEFVGDVCVSQIEGEYVMYYLGGGDPKMIGRAVSADGVTWTKYNDLATTEAPFAKSDPVLQADQGWETGKLEQPCAQWQDGRWVLTYVAGHASGIGYAVSADGIKWLKSPQNPILQPSVLGQRQNLLGVATATHEQTVFLYFQPYLTAVDRRGIFVATWQEP